MDSCQLRYGPVAMKRPLTTSLRQMNPTLAKQWHPTKNIGLTPDDVSPGTNRKAWWICSKGHEWEASIGSRNSGVGCPFCSQRRAGYGNDFATLHPQLAREWHPTKNGEKTPDMFLPRSNKKVWWLGACGHEWDAVIANRTGGPRAGCPYCANQKVGYGNDLTTRFPKIAEEWHPTKNGDLTPDQVTFGSGQRVWWRCVNGDEWQAQVYKRTAEKQSCERCGLIGVSILELQLFAELRQVLGKHLDPCAHDVRVASPVARQQKLRIDIVIGDIAVEFDGSHWHKDKVERDQEKTRLLELAGYKVIRLREHPLIPLSPLDVAVPRATTGLEAAIAAFHQMLAYDLLVGEAARAARAYVAAGKLVADDMAQRMVTALREHEYGDNSLATQHPAVAAEWHPTLNGDLTPLGVRPSAHRKVWWLCTKGHAYQAFVDLRTSKGTGCGFCSGRYATAETSLAAKRPDLSAQWHPTLNAELTPVEVTPYSRQKVWWLCSNGHVTQDTVNNRSKGMVCPQCPNGRRASSLASKRPKLAAQWHPTLNGALRPEDVAPYSSRLVWWLCPNGHVTQEKPTNRSSGMVCAGCSTSPRRKPLPDTGQTQLPITEPMSW